MRTDTPPFDDPQVRKALRLAADRQAMTDLVVQGEGTIACDTTVAPADPHRWDGECEQDIAQARELLAEAGYPDGIDVTLYTSNTLPPMVPLAEVYQQQAAEAGINVTIEQVSPDTYWTDVWGVEPMFVAGDIQYPADFLLHLYHHSDSLYNISYFANPAFEQLLADARAALDEDERTALYQQAQQLLLEDGGTLVPFHQTELRAFRDTVAGVEPITRYDLPWHGITIEPAAE
jgi:peptide/nickel transport system substrate-binding protein